MGVHFAATSSERNAIYRLRYEVYVREMSYYRDWADHGRGILQDEHDAGGRLLYATAANKLVGTARLHWGGDGPFPSEFEETYDLSRFSPFVRDREKLVVTRFMLLPGYRSSLFAFQMIGELTRFALQAEVQLALCDCRPHLLNLYSRMGFRPYHRTYNDRGMGLMIPLAYVMRDISHLNTVNSPLRRYYRIHFSDSPVARQLASAISQAEAVRSPTDHTDGGEDWSRCRRLLLGPDRPETEVLRGLSKDDILRLLDGSHVIRCRAGDKIISKGGTDRAVFMLLSGRVEVRDGNRLVGVTKPGAMLGGDAFLRGERHRADVCSASEDVRILSIDETSLRRMRRTRFPEDPAGSAAESDHRVLKM